MEKIPSKNCMFCHIRKNKVHWGKCLAFQKTMASLWSSFYLWILIVDFCKVVHPSLSHHFPSLDSSQASHFIALCARPPTCLTWYNHLQPTFQAYWKTFLNTLGWFTNTSISLSSLWISTLVFFHWETKFLNHSCQNLLEHWNFDVTYYFQHQ